MSNTREESYAVETNKKKTVKLLGKKSLLNNRNSPDENNSTDPNDEDEDEEEDAPTRLNMRYATEKKVHSPYRHVRTRLYFTSESHLHSLLNILKYAHLEEDLRKRASGDKKRSSQHVAANSSPPKAATMTTQNTNSGGTSKTNAFGDLLLSRGNRRALRIPPPTFLLMPDPIWILISRSRRETRSSSKG